MEAFVGPGRSTFARELADWLKAAHQAKAYERLILVAPPRTLGDLRQHLDPQVAKQVTAEIDKDLTHHSLQEVEQQVARVLAV